MKNFKHLLGLGLILAGIIIFVITYSVWTKNPKTIDSRDAQNTEVQGNEEQTEPAPFEPAVDGQYSYQYVSDGGANVGKMDGKIYRTNLKTGQKTVHVPSIQSLVSDEMREDLGLAEDNTWSMQQIAHSPNKPYLYFSFSFIEGAQGIVRYDGSDNTLKPLNISSYYDSFSASNSPGNGLSAISLSKKNGSGDGRTLYLLNLDTDTASTLLTLPPNRTFNVCGLEGCLGSLGMNSDWINANEFVIDIYDAKAGTDENGNPKAILVESRKIKIN